MNRSSDNFILTAAIIIIAIILHRLTSLHTITYLSAPLTLSIIFTWTKNRPWRYLLVLALITELFSLAPIGLSTIIILLPSLIYRLRGRFDVDLSFSFLILLLISAISQTILQLSPLLTSSFIADGSLISILTTLPLRQLSLSVVSITVTTFIAILATHNLRPSDNKVVSIDRQPIGMIQ